MYTKTSGHKTASISLSLLQMIVLKQIRTRRETKAMAGLFSLSSASFTFCQWRTMSGVRVLAREPYVDYPEAGIPHRVSQVEVFGRIVATGSGVAESRGYHRQFGFEPTSFCMWGAKPAGMSLPSK